MDGWRILDAQRRQAVAVVQGTGQGRGVAANHGRLVGGGAEVAVLVGVSRDGVGGKGGALEGIVPERGGRSSVGVRDACQQAAGVVGILLPRSASPCRAERFAVGGVGVGNG
jgi:hypothetical protein